MTAYLYKWTHLPSKKWYIGSKSSRDADPANHERYICSSEIVKPLILESRNDWSYEILETGDANVIRKRETELLNLLNAKDDPMSFNRSNACFDPGNRLGRKESSETRKKKSLARQGNLNPSFGKRGVDSPIFGSKRSAESKKKISQALKQYNQNRPATHNENISKALKNNPKLSQRMQGENNPMFGKPCSEHNKSMSRLKNSGKNNPMCKTENQVRCEHCDKVVAKNHYTMYHGSKCKSIKE